MNRKAKTWIVSLLLLSGAAYAGWQIFCADPCKCRVGFNPLPEESVDIDFKVIEYTTKVIKRDSDNKIIQGLNGEVTFDSVLRRDTIYYRSDEWLLDGSHPTAEASRDSLREWGFCKVESCPCPGMLELWRYSGNKKVRGIDTPTGDAVVDVKKGTSGIGGLELNYVIDFSLPEPVEPGVVYNPEQVSPNSSMGCKPQPVKIAIVDTGVDISKEPRAALATPTFDWNPISGLIPPCKTNTLTTQFGLNILGKDGNWEPIDSNGHATHINGIIAGIAPNGGNRMGVRFKFLNVKILGSDNTCTLFDAMCGLYYAMYQGAEVINISWGFKDTIAPTEIFAPFFREAQTREIVLVAGLGNDSMDVDGAMKFWPACFADNVPNLISVGALDSLSGGLASFSNWSHSGKYMNVAAPGKKIISAFPVHMEGKSTSHKPNDIYSLAKMSGTSMATPYVTRTAAVLIGLNKGMGNLYTAASLKSRIITTACCDSTPVHRRLNHDGKASLPCCHDIGGVVQCPLIPLQGE